MKNKTIIYLVSFMLMGFSIMAQQGKMIRFSSTHAMFPDTARDKGHDYNGKHYEAVTNYSDSSILVYVPKQFSSKGKVNLVFWFHGWNNNIDSACKQFELLQQFDASARKAVFVFPEGPKNAPDSYGGKLEQPNVFQALVKEVADKLVKNKILKNKPVFSLSDYSITLAGHSGAYRVISRIINQTAVDEVILFDAMYGGNDAYLQWISEPDHRFINIYTKEGGTFENSHFIMNKLTDSLRVPVISLNEEAVTETVLQNTGKLFIYSSVGHNEVIKNNRNWERFLRKTPAK